MQAFADPNRQGATVMRWPSKFDWAFEISREVSKNRGPKMNSALAQNEGRCALGCTESGPAFVYQAKYADLGGHVHY